MHYYKRNLGDYAKKAGRLTMLQHGAYTLLIDACYDRESFPTLQEAIEWTWASTAAEIEAVEFVLRKFFVLENGFYVQKRIEEEIADYHSKADTNKRIAIERETKRKTNPTKRAPVVNTASPAPNEPPPNQEPRTKNQEPSKTPRAARGVASDGFEDFWNAWPKSERKQDKTRCAATWATNDYAKVKDQILADITTKRQTEKWRGGYIEAPLVYLHNERWKDGVTPDGPDGPGSAVAEWHESAAGVDAKAAELGLPPCGPFEQRPAFKARVIAGLRAMDQQHAISSGVGVQQMTLDQLMAMRPRGMS